MKKYQSSSPRTIPWCFVLDHFEHKTGILAVPPKVIDMQVKKKKKDPFVTSPWWIIYCEPNFQMKTVRGIYYVSVL